MPFLNFPTTLAQAINRVAWVAAALALFIAPFRASAGIRGSLLILAGLALLALYVQARRLRSLLPPDAFLRFAVVLWVLAGAAWSFMGPSTPQSLTAVKRDILFPVLAFLVFYALTRTREDLLRWVYVIVTGLLMLTVMAVRDPFNALSPAQEPMYVSLGWLTTWLVTLAPTLVVLLFVPHRERRNATAYAMLLSIAILCVVVSAWLSGNRTVWACFAAMAVVGAALAFRSLRTPRERRRLIAVAAVLLLAIGILMADSMRSRAVLSSPASTGTVAFMLKDNRAAIWREAFAMIGESPWLGYGYANPDLPDAFAARFADPWSRRVFRQPHNLVLNHTLQMGIAGAVVIVLLFAALAQAYVRRLRSNRLAQLAGVCGVALVIGVFLRNSTDDFFSRHGVLFFGAVAGMLLGLGTRRPPLPGVNGRRRQSPVG